MTQKDLLYLEDAVKHQDNLANIWTHYQEVVSTKELSKFIKSEIKKLNKIKERIINTMEDK